MTNTETLCMSCMTDIGKNLICPDCGSQPHENRNAVALPLKTLLNKRFLVGRVLGDPGGFGITYLVWDMLLDTTAAIKEFLPLSSVSRHSDNSSVKVNSKKDQDSFNQGLRIFLKEAKILAQFSHPNIVRIRDCFTSNNTAYLVMEYHQGAPLNQFIESSGGYLTEDRALEIILPILDGLDAVHSKDFLHRDIKPQNIYITTKGVPLLLDFGASRFALTGTDQTLTVMLSGGYAPFEQYHKKGRQGPWGDIYSVGATLYFMVTGKKPTNAIERQQHDSLVPPTIHNPALSESFSLAIMQAMSIDPLARPQNVNAFKQILTSSSYLLPTKILIPAALNTTEVSPVVPKKKSDTQSVIIQYQAKKSNWSFSQFFLYMALFAVLLFGWNKQQMPENTNNNNTVVLNTSQPVMHEPNMMTNKLIADNEVEVELVNLESEVTEYREDVKSDQPVSLPRQNKLMHKPKLIPPLPAHAPDFAVAACKYKSVHAHCRFDTPRGVENGVCLQMNNEQLACIPDRPPPPPPPRFRQSRQF